MLSPEEIALIRADLPACLSVLQSWTRSWKVNVCVLFACTCAQAYGYAFLYICVCLMYLQAPTGSTDTSTTSLHFYNMRLKEPTALLETRNHLVDHVCWKQSQKFDFWGNWHRGEEHGAEISPILMENSPHRYSPHWGDGWGKFHPWIYYIKGPK